MSNRTRHDSIFDDRDRQAVAYNLFKAGNDTSDIASFLHIHESEALRLVSQQRSLLLGVQSPYPSAPVGSLSVRNVYQRLSLNSGG
ncbi:hypothetical protein FHT87_005201 [Rhizobium sp. BK316]|uniref:hypothetical protein n=1 Tax=Rhizobium sp. BK316 TaxID=2587053 RepID=UPI00160E4D27|nr:hypothetical protein [Rhizobium sp. BK316]MBB3411248.1 hypothetical protein [Rhizobium sp. BK316]